MKGNSNLGLLCVLPVASEWSDLQEKRRRACSERQAFSLGRKQPRYQALASRHVQIVTGFFFFNFLFRSDQEQTHNTETQTLNFSTRCFPHTGFYQEPDWTESHARGCGRWVGTQGPSPCSGHPLRTLVLGKIIFSQSDKMPAVCLWLIARVCVATPPCYLVLLLIVMMAWGTFICGKADLKISISDCFESSPTSLIQSPLQMFFKVLVHFNALKSQIWEWVS